MTGWYIFGGIVLALFLLAMLNIRICLTYREALSVKLKILFFSFSLYPKREKTIRAKDFSSGVLQKKQRREEAKRARAEAKAKRHAAKGQKKAHGAAQSSGDLLGGLTLILNGIRDTIPRFLRHLHLKIARIRILVATDDPAKTGILYGAVCAVISQLTEVLAHITHVSRAKESVSVSADFLPGKPSADIHLVFSIRVWQAVHIGISMAALYLKNKMKKSQKPETPPRREEPENNGGTQNG